MAEGIGGGAGKILERFAEGVPGFALAVIVVGAVLPMFVPGVPAEWRELYPVFAVVLSYIGQFLGHYLDKPFQPVWGVRPSELFLRFKSIRNLDNARADLAEQWHQPITGIYEKASQILRKTEAWEKKVKWPLEISKGCRSLFVIGVIAIFAKPFTDVIRIDFGPLIVAAVLLLAGYVRLRVKHVTNLYTAAQMVEYGFRNGFLCVAQSAIPLRRVLLCTKDPNLKTEDFDNTKVLVMSLSLMHVDLLSFRGAKSSRWEIKQEMPLHLDWVRRMREEDPVYASGEETLATLPDPQAHQAFDLLLTLESTESPTKMEYGTEVWKTRRELVERLNSGIREPTLTPAAAAPGGRHASP